MAARSASTCAFLRDGGMSENGRAMGCSVRLRTSRGIMHGLNRARMHGEKRDILKFGMAFCRKNLVVCKE